MDEKNPKTAKLNEAKSRTIWLSEEFCNPIISGIVLLLINYKAADFRSRYLQVFLRWGAALATHPTHLTMSWCFLVCFFFMTWLLCNSSLSSCCTGNPWLWLFWLVSLNLRKLPFSHNGFWNTMWLLCHVMSCWHSTLFCTDWFILCFVEIDWLETNYPIFLII